MGDRIALALENARIVSEGQERLGSVAVLHDGTIGQIVYGEDASLAGAADEVVDCDGDYLLPGLIDAHVHFREPGLTHKGDMATESRAAVAGGVTSFIDMPNTKPITDNLSAVRAKYAMAQGRSWANYGFHLGATNSNIEEIRRAANGEVAAVKLFMGSSTGDMKVEERATLERIFAESPLPVITHCETDGFIAERMQQAQEKYGDEIPFAKHAWIRGREGCIKSTQLAMELAKAYGTRLHVLHLSTAEEATLFRNLQGTSLAQQITAETCPQYLLFDDGDYARKEGLLKCNPSVKSASDRLALWEALRQRAIMTIGTDHAPHLIEEKLRPYASCPSGIASIQHHLCALLDRAEQEQLPVPQLVESLCHNPARLFGIAGRGFICEGYAADLVRVKRLYNSVLPQTLPFVSRCKWSIYKNIPTFHRVMFTLVNGTFAYRVGCWSEQPGGQALRFHAQESR